MVPVFFNFLGAGGGRIFAIFRPWNFWFRDMLFSNKLIFMDFFWKMDPNLLDFEIQIVSWNFQNSSQFTTNNNLVEASFQFVPVIYLFLDGRFFTIFLGWKTDFDLYKLQKNFVLWWNKWTEIFVRFYFFWNCQISILGFQ